MRGGPAGEFPEDPWAAAGILAQAGRAELDDLEKWALRWHGAPRSFALAERFCREVLPAGRVLLYGAGSHSARLVDILRTVSHLEPVGVLDRLADAVSTFHGLPVHAPADAARLPADYVLIAHTSFEEEMSSALAATGYPAERIRTLYSSAAYAVLSRKKVEEIAALADGVAGKAPLENLVVTSAHASVVPDDVLADLQGRGRTLHAFLGRADGHDPDCRFETIDLLESMAALKSLLQRTRPRTIYVRTILYKNFLLPLVKRWAPQAVVVGEPYDFTILWSDRDLELLFGLNGRTIRMMRLGELLAGRELDMLVSKRGGSLWQRITAPWSAQSILFFPALQSSSERLEPGALGDLVYAGFFPAASFLKNFRSGYNFVPLMTEVCRRGGLSGALYNSAHMPGVGDPLFSDYVRTLAGPLHYHPRLPYAQMLTTLTGFRYGWLCDHRDRFQGDRHVGVCNRWTGYVGAGLPVLIDRDWVFMGELTRRFGAGLVVDELTPAAVLEQIDAADWPALQAGTVRLRSHLEEWNRAALQSIAACLQSPSARRN